MQVMFVLGLDFALSKTDELAPRQITRIGLQDDMTFIGSAAALNRTWNSIEDALANAGHRLRGCKCGVWAPGFEQFEDAELPMEVRNLCLRVPRKRHGVSLLGSAANMQHCMHVGLGQPAEAPTQTIESVEKALATLQSIERLACDQHDHVSFAKAWMLMGKGVADALATITTSGWSRRTYDDGPATNDAWKEGAWMQSCGAMRKVGSGDAPCSLEVLSLSWHGSERNSPRALRSPGHLGCSDGLRGAGNVLVGC